MSRTTDGPQWPTKARKQRARRRGQRGDNRKSQGDRIADELVAERSGTIPRREITHEQHEPVVITTLWDGLGQAYVRPRSGDKRVVVSFGPRFYDCHQCGRQREPTCEHALLIPDSAALQRARRIRNITTNK